MDETPKEIIRMVALLAASIAHSNNSAFRNSSDIVTTAKVFEKYIEGK